MVVGADPGQQRIGANRGRRAFGKVGHGAGMLPGTRSLARHLTQQRMVDVGEVLEAVSRNDTKRGRRHPLQRQCEHTGDHASRDGREQRRLVELGQVTDDVDWAAVGQGDDDQDQRREKPGSRASDEHVRRVLSVVEEDRDAKRRCQIDHDHWQRKVHERCADDRDDEA